MEAHCIPMPAHSPSKINTQRTVMSSKKKKFSTRLFHLFFAFVYWKLKLLLCTVLITWFVKCTDYMYCYVLYWNVIDYMYWYVCIEMSLIICIAMYCIEMPLIVCIAMYCIDYMHCLLSCIVIECIVHWLYCYVYELLFWVHASLTLVLFSIFQSKYQSSKERECSIMDYCLIVYMSTMFKASVIVTPIEVQDAFKMPSLIRTTCVNTIV